MANDLNNLIESLSSAHVDDKDEGTLSFEGKQLKLNTAEDGSFQRSFPFRLCSLNFFSSF